MRFLTKIYHPNIDKVSLDSGFLWMDWTGLDVISHIGWWNFNAAWKNMPGHSQRQMESCTSDKNCTFEVGLRLHFSSMYFSLQLISKCLKFETISVTLNSIILLLLAFKHFWVLQIPMIHSRKILRSIGNQMRLKLLKQVRFYFRF